MGSRRSSRGRVAHRFIRYRTESRTRAAYVVVGAASGDETDEVWTRRAHFVRELRDVLDLESAFTRGEWERDICRMLTERGKENALFSTRPGMSSPGAATRLVMLAERIFEHLLDVDVLRSATREDLERLRSGFLDVGSTSHFVVDEEKLQDWCAERLVVLGGLG